VFSDECSAETGKGAETLWSWGPRHSQYDRNRVQSFKKGKQGAVMVWAAIGLDFGTLPLMIIPRGPKGTCRSAEYIQTLQEGLLPFYEQHDLVFQQDNARIHTSRESLTWLLENGVRVYLLWPPYSPDLNCIEHLWARLKDALYKRVPKLLGPLTKAQQVAMLKEWLPIVWAEISPDLTEVLVESMPDRVQAVIAAQGWYTKY
jgi:transposase